MRGLISTLSRKWLLAGAVALAAPTMALAGPHDGHDHNDVHVNIRIGDNHRYEPRYEERRERVWVPPVHRTVYDRQWIEPVYETRCERIWVPDQYEFRTVRRYDPHCGHWVTCTERVLVCAGHWKEEHRRVCVREGYWQTFERQECVAEGHYEWRVTQVRCDDGPRYHPVEVINPALRGLGLQVRR